MVILVRPALDVTEIRDLPNVANTCCEGSTEIEMGLPVGENGVSERIGAVVEIIGTLWWAEQ